MAKRSASDSSIRADSLNEPYDRSSWDSREGFTCIGMSQRSSDCVHIMSFIEPRSLKTFIGHIGIIRSKFESELAANVRTVRDDSSMARNSNFKLQILESPESAQTLSATLLPVQTSKIDFLADCLSPLIIQITLPKWLCDSTPINFLKPSKLVADRNFGSECSESLLNGNLALFSKNCKWTTTESYRQSCGRTPSEKSDLIKTLFISLIFFN